MSKIQCPTCRGKGEIEHTDPNRPCEARVQIDDMSWDESLPCMAEKVHPGKPHWTFVPIPCPLCFGMELHSEWCKQDASPDQCIATSSWVCPVHLEFDDKGTYWVKEIRA